MEATKWTCTGLQLLSTPTSLISFADVYHHRKSPEGALFRSLKSLKGEVCTAVLLGLSFITRELTDQFQLEKRKIPLKTEEMLLDDIIEIGKHSYFLD